MMITYRAHAPECVGLIPAPATNFEGIMAFIKKTGKSYTVRQGNNNKLLSRHGSLGSAEKQLDFLHKKNKPKSTNRGKRAAGRF